MQLSDESTGATSVRFAVRVPPFRLAVIVAVWSAFTAAMVAVNVALVCPEFTVTVAGTVTFALLSESPTEVAEAAAATRVTVQVDVPGAFTLAGEQLKVFNCAGAVRLSVNVRLTALRVAVTIALWLVAIVPEFAENVAVL